MTPVAEGAADAGDEQPHDASPHRARSPGRPQRLVVWGRGAGKPKNALAVALLRPARERQEERFRSLPVSRREA
jgi:hypothetical protein